MNLHYQVKYSCARHPPAESQRLIYYNMKIQLRGLPNKYSSTKLYPINTLLQN